MSDFKQYIKNIGHVDFELQPLNEVDIAVMVEMVYLKLDDYVSHDRDGRASCRERV